MNIREKILSLLRGRKALAICTALAFVSVAASVAVTHYTSRSLANMIPTASSRSTTIFSLNRLTEHDIGEYDGENEAARHDDDTEAVEPDEVQTEKPEADTAPSESRPQQNISQDSEQRTAAEEEQPSAQAAAGLKMPCSGEIIKQYSTEAAVYSATMQDWRIHTGTDFRLSEGEKVLAVCDGTVTRVLSDPMWGYIVEIDCGDFTARYCGMSQEDCVGIDTEVRAGQEIGSVGEIPIESADGEHLHFEILLGAETVDPIGFISERLE